MGLMQTLGNRRRRRGMAMVEMVFVLPVLLVLVFAIAEMGLMFSRWLTLSNAVREGARDAVVFRTPCVADDVKDAVQVRVSDYAAAGGVPLDPDDDTEIVVTGHCVAGGDSVVSATYDFPFQVLPGLTNMGPTIALSYTSTMRNEF